ncbi:MAG: hypothetical protein ABI045_04785 [Flavobacteriales bacterium]
MSCIGGLDIPFAFQILAAVEIYRYRNKMGFLFSNAWWLSDKEI